MSNHRGSSCSAYTGVTYELTTDNTGTALAASSDLGKRVSLDTSYNLVVNTNVANAYTMTFYVKMSVPQVGSGASVTQAATVIYRKVYLTLN